jgi:hypothetical protein
MAVSANRRRFCECMAIHFPLRGDTLSTHLVEVFDLHGPVLRYDRKRKLPTAH